MKQVQRKQWYPRAQAERRPSSWWYFGRAVYVSRRDYWRIFLRFISVGIPLGLLGLLLRSTPIFVLALCLAWLGIVLLVYSLLGLYRMYGHPAIGYIRRLLALGRVAGPVTIADLHIGTYRHAYLLAEALPQARISSIDCWDERIEGEEAIQDVRAVEVPPRHERIQPLRAPDQLLPLATASCDVVVFGFGTHEIPAGERRDQLFQEALRILKPGGRLLMFEHGYDLHNYAIFGPVIRHVTRRQEWLQQFERYLGDVRYARCSQAVDLFAGVRP